MLRVGNELILGEYDGLLEVVDMKSFNITHSHRFKEADDINDVISIFDNLFLIGAKGGLLRTTRDQVKKHNFKWKSVRTL
jgi:hypothetical protein